MPDFFDKFFENWIKEDLSPIKQFENLYDPLISYYNYNFDDTVMPEEDYNIFFNTMKKQLETKEQQNFVERFRPLGNKLSLRLQLSKIFEQLEYLKDEEKRKHYVGMVVDLRNRIQHATENISPELLRNSSNMTHNLNSFTSDLILHEIEYNKKD